MRSQATLVQGGRRETQNCTQSHVPRLFSMGRRKADTQENRSSLECLFEYEKPTEENVANVSAVLGPSTSVLNIN